MNTTCKTCSFQIMANYSDSPMDEMQFIMKNIKDTSKHYKRSDLINNEELKMVNSALNRILQDIINRIERNKRETCMEYEEDIQHDDD